MKTQGIDILTHHLKNTIAQELNEACDKENRNTSPRNRIPYPTRNTKSNK